MSEAGSKPRSYSSEVSLRRPYSTRPTPMMETHGGTALLSKSYLQEQSNCSASRQLLSATDSNFYLLPLRLAKPYLYFCKRSNSKVLSKPQQGRAPRLRTRSRRTVLRRCCPSSGSG